MKWTIQVIVLVSLIGSLLGKVVPVKRENAALAAIAEEPVVAEFRENHGHDSHHHGHATSYQNVVLHSYHPKVVHVGKHDHGHH